MKVAAIMTRDVVTVAADATLKDVASLLTANRISGVPVCGQDGAVVGVVSERDILWKEIVPREHAGIAERMLDDVYGSGDRFDARTAADAMTSPAIVATPDTDVATAARLMLDHRVNRLPVVDHGRLVGIVSRADLVRVFRRSDEEIEREISDDVLKRLLWLDPDAISLLVTEGEVTVAGEVEDHTTAELVAEYVRRVPGVVSVTSHLTWSIDDRSRRTRRRAAHTRAPRPV